LRKGFLIAGIVLAVLGLSILLFYGPSSVNISNLITNIYLRNLVGLAPGLVVVIIGAWLISRALSGVVVPKDLKDMLGSNEKVQLYVKQVNYRPRPMGVDSWLLTNERVIQRHPHGLKLKNSYEDHSYSEIKTLKFDQGILRSKVSCLLKEGPEQMETNVDVKTSEIQGDKPLKVLENRIKKFETGLEGKFDLTLLAKSDARHADGIIRENIVRFQTPFFQTPFPSDKIAFDSSQKAT
jgi:hypothetical protein